MTDARLTAEERGEIERRIKSAIEPPWRRQIGNLVAEDVLRLLASERAGWEEAEVALRVVGFDYVALVSPDKIEALRAALAGREPAPSTREERHETK